MFNPDKQFDYCADLQRVYTGKAPSLGVLNEAFGRNITETWLAIQIQNLSEFSGVKDKIDAAQIDMLAKVIIATFHFLKVTELMHFFLQFKSGKYGKFYGAVDGMAITEALQEFCRERSYKIFLFEQEREKEEAQRRMEESRKNACTWEEYLRQKGEKQRPSPLARTEEQLNGQ